MAKTLFDAEIGFRVEVCLNLVPCAGAIGWRKAGGATPGPLVQQWASCLTAHVGSDPVHQETGTLRLDQPFGREYTIGAQKLPFLNEAARHAVSEALAQRQARPSGQSLIRPCAGKTQLASAARKELGRNFRKPERSMRRDTPANHRPRLAPSHIDTSSLRITSVVERGVDDGVPSCSA
jgi:hypothetical protein